MDKLSIKSWWNRSWFAPIKCASKHDDVIDPDNRLQTLPSGFTFKKGYKAFHKFKQAYS